MTGQIRHYAKDEAGFSFAELMVVIAIISIMSAIALPNLIGRLPEKRLKNAARNLYSDMQRVRLQSVKENTALTVTFDPANETYSYLVSGTARTVSLETEYGDVRFGCDNAGTDWNNNAVPASGVTADGNLIFMHTGTASSDIDPNATEVIIFLGSDNVNVCYAVGVTRFGAARIKWKPDGSSTWN